MEDENDIITILFEKKQDYDMFNFKSEELTEWETRKRNFSDQLFILIGTKVHPKLRNKLAKLIEDYKEAKNECCAIENKLYYREGLKDGVHFEQTLNN